MAPVLRADWGARAKARKSEGFLVSQARANVLE